MLKKLTIFCKESNEDRDEKNRERNLIIENPELPPVDSIPPPSSSSPPSQNKPRQFSSNSKGLPAIHEGLGGIRKKFSVEKLIPDDFTNMVREVKIGESIVISDVETLEVIAVFTIVESRTANRIKVGCRLPLESAADDSEIYLKKRSRRAAEEGNE